MASSSMRCKFMPGVEKSQAKTSFVPCLGMMGEPAMRNKTGLGVFAPYSLSCNHKAQARRGDGL